MKFQQSTFNNNLNMSSKLDFLKKFGDPKPFGETALSVKVGNKEICYSTVSDSLMVINRLNIEGTNIIVVFKEKNCVEILLKQSFIFILDEFEDGYFLINTMGLVVDWCLENRIILDSQDCLPLKLNLSTYKVKFCDTIEKSLKSEEIQQYYDFDENSY